ncbi:MAG: hypothetical protein EXQ98_04015 [Alphaproteobacteria bacterium]|nr:hypothetical protein [Alphaproteobacteria bacterium]
MARISRRIGHRADKIARFPGIDKRAVGPVIGRVGQHIALNRPNFRLVEFTDNSDRDPPLRAID